MRDDKGRGIYIRRRQHSQGFGSGRLKAKVLATANLRSCLVILVRFWLLRFLALVAGSSGAIVEVAEKRACTSLPSNIRLSSRSSLISSRLSTLLPLSPCLGGSGNAAVTAGTADMCLEGAAEPPSVWVSLSFGTGVVTTRDTTSPVAEEGAVIRVNHVKPDAGVVEGTPANMAKRSVT